MTTQVNNGELYLARYCGPLSPNDDPQRVEIRKQRATLLLDISWPNFEEIIRLGQQLIEKCKEEEHTHEFRWVGHDSRG